MRICRFTVAALWLVAVALVSCESQSQIDTGFLGTPTSTTTNSFNQTFTFNTGNTASYTFNNSKIDFTGGFAELTPFSRDNNDTASGFGGGSVTGTAWDATNSYLRLDQTGSATDLELDASWAPAWSNLVGYWKMNGVGAIPNGTAIGAAVGPGGTASNVNGTGMTYGPGKLNQGIVLDGIDDFIKIPNTASINNIAARTATVIAWVKTSSAAMQIVFSTWDGTKGYQVFIDVGGKVALWGDSSGINLTSNTVISDGNWHQIAAVFDGTNGSIYSDGVMVLSGARTFTASSRDNQIGTQCSGVGSTGCNDLVNATIDEVSVWNTPLSATAIASIYQHQLAKYAGTFTSRVMDAGVNQTWTKLGWTSTLPFLKELADGGSSESQANYSSQSNSLTNGLVGLWHLDEAAGTAGAGSVKDRSGLGNDAAPVGGVTFGQPAKFGNAVTLNGSNGFVDIPHAASLNSMNGVASFGAWIKPALTGINQQIFSTYDSTSGHGGQVYVKATTGNLSLWTDVGGNFNTGTLVADGKWHYVVATFDGAMGRLYVDGVSLGAQAGSFHNSSLDSQIGAECDAAGGTVCDSFFQGSIDEVAVWNRVLTDGAGGTPNEILELYRRGANRILYQVRSCPDSTCSTNPSWLGPDGTNQSYFSELNNNAIQVDGSDLSGADSVLTGLPSMLFSNFASLTVPANRYFEYRAIMESDDPGTGCNYGSGVTWCSPELQSVTASPQFTNTNPTLSNNTGVSDQTLTAFSETLGTNGCSSGTLYNISQDGAIWYYWTGGAWGLADGTTAKANSASAINANISSFASQVGAGSFHFRTFLQSSGTSACELSAVDVLGTR